MPRPITVYPADIVGLNKEVNDVIHDYKVICRYYLDNIDLSADLKEDFEIGIKKCTQHASVKLKHLNRLYITTDFTKISLMVVDLDAAVIEYMIIALKFNDIDEDSRRKYNLESCYACLWIFQGKELILRVLLEPFHFGMFMTIFKKENLVDYNASRYQWVTEPKAKASRYEDE